jgi:hypothetical protein
LYLREPVECDEGATRRDHPTIQKQAKAATDAVNQSAEAFRIDERAWVEIGKIEKTATYPPDPPFGTIFKFGIYPKNIGKTVARDVQIHIDNIDADGSFNDSEKAIRMSQDQKFKDMKTGKRSITPNKPGPQTIAPGDVSAVPVYTGSQEPKRYGDRFRYTFLIGRIDYIDTFDVKHWKHICFMVLNARGDLGHCQYGNDEDRNPETPQAQKPN